MVWRLRFRRAGEAGLPTQPPFGGAWSGTTS